tara:strand:+ start:1050 stop:2090 length:1041 start_codon:yes stop_codon:yes gene_type:complete
MATRKLKNSYQADFMVRGKRYRKVFKTADEAAEWELSLRRKIADGGPESARKSLGDVLNSVYETVWRGQAQEDDCIYQIKRFEEYFGKDTPLADITTESIDGFVAHLKSKGNKPATLNCTLAKLRKAFRFARDRGWVMDIPVIPRFQPKNRNLLWWSEDDVQEIYNAIDELCNERNGTEQNGHVYDFNAFKRFFTWQLETGMRPSESRRLHTDRVTFDDVEKIWMVRIAENTSKNGRFRVIAATHLAWSVWDHEVHVNGNGPFPWAKWTRYRTRLYWNHIRTKLGKTDPEWKFYLTRHTCASRLLQRGVWPQDVQAWCGHADLKTTMLYAKNDAKSVVRAYAALAD